MTVAPIVVMVATTVGRDVRRGALWRCPVNVLEGRLDSVQILDLVPVGPEWAKSMEHPKLPIYTPLEDSFCVGLVTEPTRELPTHQLPVCTPN